ncbi:MAG: hypothetical protein H0X64_11785 [Gemmatimonadaceae bacterium]|nr:hypothetical protein [Gemmatimonadaceae bacterium]
MQIKVKCSGDKLDVSVKPFAVTLVPGESVRWEPERAWLGGFKKNDVRVAIVPKDTTRWPFSGPLPTVPEDGSVSSGPAAANAGGTYPYDIRFTCMVDGVQRVIVVDPDIIISGRIQ